MLGSKDALLHRVKAWNDARESLDRAQADNGRLKRGFKRLHLTLSKLRFDSDNATWRSQQDRTTATATN